MTERANQQVDHKVVDGTKRRARIPVIKAGAPPRNKTIHHADQGRERCFRVFQQLGEASPRIPRLRSIQRQSLQPQMDTEFHGYNIASNLICVHPCPSVVSKHREGECSCRAANPAPIPVRLRASPETPSVSICIHPWFQNTHGCRTTNRVALQTGGPRRSAESICIPGQCTGRICRALAADLLYCFRVCQPAAGRTVMSQRGQPNWVQFRVVCSGVVCTRVHVTPMWLIGTGKRMCRAGRRAILRIVGVRSAVRSSGDAIIHHSHPFLVQIPSSCR